MLTIKAHNPIEATTAMKGVSKRYGFVSSLELIELIESHGWTLAATKFARVNKESRNGFQKHSMEFRHPGLGDTETVARMLVINSHDRSSAVHVHVGLFRFVCENGLIAGESIGDSFKVYHVGNTLQEQISALIPKVIQRATEMLQVRAMLQSRDVSELELSNFLRASALMLQESTGRFVERETLYSVSREEDAALTAWNVYNVVQERIIGGEYKAANMTTRRLIKAKPIKSILRDVKVNRQLFDLAVSFFGSVK